MLCIYSNNKYSIYSVYFSVTKRNLKVEEVFDFGHFKNVQNQESEKSLEKRC